MLAVTLMYKLENMVINADSNTICSTYCGHILSGFYEMQMPVDVAWKHGQCLTAGCNVEDLLQLLVLYYINRMCTVEQG